MKKTVLFELEEAANYFYKAERTENEDYLLHLILELGREYNKLVDDFNRLSQYNELLKKRFQLQSNPYASSYMKSYLKNRK